MNLLFALQLNICIEQHESQSRQLTSAFETRMNTDLLKKVNIILAVSYVRAGFQVAKP